MNRRTNYYRTTSASICGNGPMVFRNREEDAWSIVVVEKVVPNLAYGLGSLPFEVKP